MRLRRFNLKRTKPWSQRRRGVALIMVLLVVMAMVVLAGNFASNMRVEQILARNLANEVRLEWLCRSGMELSRYLLGQQFANQREPYTTLLQRWAGGPGGYADTSGDGSETFLDAIDINERGVAEGSLLGLLQRFDGDEGWQKYLERASVEVRIVDLERKININWAIPHNRPRDDGTGYTYPYPNRPLQEGRSLIEVAMGPDYLNVPNTEHGVIRDSLKDWIDSNDDRTPPNGFDGDEYTRQYGYRPKNDFVDDLSELKMVNGIHETREWLVSGDIPDDLEEGMRPRFLIPDLFTPISRGKININTASREVLMLVDPNMELCVDRVMEHRGGSTHIDAPEDMSDDRPIQQVSELLSLGYPTTDIGRTSSYLGQIFDVQSWFFEITVKATTGEGQTKELVAVVFRQDDRNVKVLHMYWKSGG